MHRSRSKVLYCLILIFIALISIFAFEKVPDSSSNIVIDSSYKINFLDDLSYKEFDYNDSLWEDGVFSIKSATKENQNKPLWVRKAIVIPSTLKGTDIMLLVEGITNGFEIYLNGTLIGKSPIYPNQDFNVWNTTYDYFIPKDIIKFDSENVLAIRTFSTHEYGASKDIIIGPSNSIQYKTHSSNLWRINLYFGFIILMIAFSIYFALGYYYNNKRKKQLLFSVTNLFAVIYYSNYIIYKLPISYLLFQKIVFISLQLLVISAVLFIMLFLNLKIKPLIKYTSAIMALVLTIGCIIAKNSAELFKFRNFSLICFLGLFVYLIFLMIKAFINKNKEISRLVVPTVVAIFAGTYDTFSQIFRSTKMMGIQLSGFAIIFLIILVGFEMFKEYEMLYQKARVDGLTGLYNHVSFKNELEELGSNAKAIAKGVSLVVYDIDDFKKVNDEYGHSFGDIILKTVANEISRNGTSNSFVARYGGEEFVMILIGLNKEKSIELSEKIRKKISEISFYNNNNEEIKITISGGVTSINEIKGTFSGIALFDEADQAMYYSKNNGKNRITHYSDVYQ